MTEIQDHVTADAVVMLREKLEGLRGQLQAAAPQGKVELQHKVDATTYKLERATRDLGSVALGIAAKSRARVAEELDGLKAAAGRAAAAAPEEAEDVAALQWDAAGLEARVAEKTAELAEAEATMAQLQVCPGQGDRHRGCAIAKWQL